MTPDIGTPWECPHCHQKGTLTRQQQEDYETTQTARCPRCYGAVRMIRAVGS